MRPNLIFSFALFSSLLLADSALAQDDEYAFAPASEAHRPGRWSMQFQLAEDFRFTAFEGASLAMTRNAGTDAAWRIGVNFNGDLADGGRTTITTDTVSTTEVRPIDTDRYSVRLDLLHLRRYHPARRVGLELGLGPSVNLLRYRDVLETSNPPNTTHRENRASLSQYGLTGRLGVEVFLARALSVHAHYGAFAGYEQETTTSRYEVTSTSGPGSDSVFEAQRRRWFLSNDGVSLGISVYL